MRQHLISGQWCERHLWQLSNILLRLCGTEYAGPEGQRRTWLALSKMGRYLDKWNLETTQGLAEALISTWQRRRLAAQNSVCTFRHGRVRANDPRASHLLGVSLNTCIPILNFITFLLKQYFIKYSRNILLKISSEPPNTFDHVSSSQSLFCRMTSRSSVQILT